jgi:hypothetical protein
MIHGDPHETRIAPAAGVSNVEERVAPQTIHISLPGELLAAH